MPCSDLDEIPNIKSIVLKESCQMGSDPMSKLKIAPSHNLFNPIPTEDLCRQITLALTPLQRFIHCFL